MSNEERIKALEDKITKLERVLNFSGGIITLNGTVQVKGRLNADRVYTARSGNYTELTS